MKELKTVRTVKYNKDGFDWIEDIEYTALVDDDIFEVVNKFSWYVNGDNYFTTRISGYKNTFFIHQFVVGMPLNRALVTDHKNGNVYDYSKDNLEIVTRRQNNQNKCIDSYSKLPGVSYHINRKHTNFTSSIKIKGITKHLGYFSTQVEAFFVYKAAVEALGEFIMPYVLEKCYKIIDSEMVHI